MMGANNEFDLSKGQFINKEGLPSKFTLDYLVENQSNAVLANHLLFHYEDVLKDIPFEDNPEACLFLSSTLGHIAYTMEPGIVLDKYNDTNLRICRLGIRNTKKVIVRDKTVMFDDLLHYDLLGHLFTSNALCLMNLERYYAALESLDMAEKFLLKYLAFLKETKDPQFEDEINQIEIDYELCRAREAEIWYRMHDSLPEKVRAIFLTCAYSYLIQSLAIFEDKGADWHIEYFNKILQHVIIDRAKYSYLEDKFVFDIDYREPDTSKYIEWCWDQHLLLNPFNEIPNINPDWLKDSIEFPEDVDANMVEELFKTFNHCRKLMFNYTKIDPMERFNKGRDDDVESVLDCYFRTYSLFDKIAKILNAKYNLNIDKGNVSFKKVIEALDKSHNPHIQTICRINQDVFPRSDDYTSGNRDAMYSTMGSQVSPSLLRNSIAHLAIKIVSKEEKTAMGRKYPADTVVMTSRELEEHIIVLLYRVRELLLTLQLAFNNPE